LRSKVLGDSPPRQSHWASRQGIEALEMVTDEGQTGRPQASGQVEHSHADDWQHFEKFKHPIGRCFIEKS
jgi:hypothetical protein